MRNEISRRELAAGGFLSMALAACAHRARSGRATDLFQHIGQIMQGLVDDGRASGVGYGVRQWGEPSLIGFHGLADIAAARPVDAETVFRIASVTKTFVAAAVMQSIERGDLTLEQKLSDFFPEFPRADDVTIYQLLSHTSGLKEWWEGGLPEGTPPNFLMEPAPHRYIQAMREHYNFEPGAYHWYSNCGYILLGEIVEIASGRALRDYLHQDVFARAELAATELENLGLSDPHWARGYAPAAGQTPPFSEQIFVNMPGAAGCLRSTVSDLLSWSDALFAGRVVSQASIESMTRMATVADGRPTSAAIWTPPNMTEPPQPPAFMQSPGWGLGLSLFTSNDQLIAWHSGGIPGFNAIWFNLPARRLSLVLLSNTDNGAVPAFEPAVVRATL
jgi:CubicO group peptidase (beta-lactamase class C family)